MWADGVARLTHDFPRWGVFKGMPVHSEGMPFAPVHSKLHYAHVLIVVSCLCLACQHVVINTDKCYDDYAVTEWKKTEVLYYN